MQELLDQLKAVQKKDSLNRLYQIKKRFINLCIEDKVNEQQSVYFREMYNQKLCIFLRNKKHI